jgi:hypothetical protein
MVHEIGKGSEEAWVAVSFSRSRASRPMRPKRQCRGPPTLHIVGGLAAIAGITGDSVASFGRSSCMREVFLSAARLIDPLS